GENRGGASGDSTGGTESRATLPRHRPAEKPRLSNPYLSQIERGLHQPSMRVIKVLSEALNVSAETLLTHAGLLHREGQETEAGQRDVPDVEQAITADGRLSEQQKAALISGYQGMLGAGQWRVQGARSGPAKSDAGGG